MKAPLVLLVVLALAACQAPVDSETPLLPASAGGPKSGLWALTDPACGVPKTTDPAHWPDCAIAVRITAHSWSAPTERGLGGPLSVAEGPPWVLQIGIPANAPGGSGKSAGYIYAAADPEGPAPFTKARVWLALCPVQASTAEYGVSEDGCRARDAEAARKAVLLAMRGEAAEAVWIAP